MSERNDGPWIVVWVTMCAALAFGFLFVLLPVVAHLAWDLFVHFWNLV